MRASTNVPIFYRLVSSPDIRYKNSQFSVLLGEKKYDRSKEKNIINIAVSTTTNKTFNCNSYRVQLLGTAWREVKGQELSL